MSEDFSRAELEARIAELEAAKVESTRDRSPVKPADHQPAATDTFELEFYGVECVVEKRMLKDWRLQRIVGRAQKGDIGAGSEILDFLLGEEKQNAIIDAMVEQDGWCNDEKIGELTQTLFEKVGAGK